MWWEIQYYVIKWWNKCLQHQDDTQLAKNKIITQREWKIQMKEMDTTWLSNMQERFKNKKKYKQYSHAHLLYMFSFGQSIISCNHLTFIAAWEIIEVWPSFTTTWSQWRTQRKGGKQNNEDVFTEKGKTITTVIFKSVKALWSGIFILTKWS